MTSAHPPFDVRIFYKECLSISKSGFQVSLIVASHDSIINSSVNFIGITKRKSRLQRIFITCSEILWAAIKNKADIYHFHDPELIPAGFILKLLGRKVVYDVHEDLPRQILSKHWLPTVYKKPLSWLASLMEFVAGHSFDAVVAVTPYIASRFSVGKVCLLQNYPLLEEFPASPENKYSLRPMQVAYIGGLTKIRGLIEIVEAMEFCSGYETPLLLAGDFQSEAFSSEIKKLKGWQKVEFVGWQDREAVVDMLGNIRAGLVLFHPVANHINAQPNKMFEYMAAGLPVIASDFPLWREIIATNKCGLLVDPMNPRAITEAINWIFENPDEAYEMGQRGRRVVLDIYNWDAEKNKLIELYKKVLK